jgi:GNAT superfamily N-acetyltransferase
VRPATPADAPAVVALVQSAYRGESSRAGWTTEADLLDDQRTSEVDVLALLASAGGSSAVLLAEDGDDGSTVLLGCCHVADHGEGTAYFGMFAVRPDRQAAGLGRQLLAAAERHARDAWHALRMEMTVIDVRRELIDWYVRRGYTVTDETRPFPHGDHLRFAVLVKPLA